MDRLLANELAEAAARSGATSGNKPKKNTSSSVSSTKQQKQKASKKPTELASSSSTDGEARMEKLGYLYNNEDDEAEDDDELRENGSFVPDGPSDPADRVAAEAFTGRRVFIDGIPGRNGHTGEIIAWRGKQWEVELDKGDERVMVRSLNLMWLDQVPTTAAAGGGARKSGSGGATSSSGASPGGIKKKPKKLKQKLKAGRAPF